MSPLKTRVVLCVFLVLFASNAYSEASTDMRPALLGNHKRSLINLVNAESLMKRGQTDAIVMFSVGVTQLGSGYNMQVYRGTPNRTS